MENVIMILIDSVTSECLGNTQTGISSTPFLDTMLKESLYVPNMYSYGPYTDAATKGLYTGTETLDEYGYFFQLNESKENHYKVFKDNGYETFGFYYPYYLNGKNVYRYIDHSIFLSGMVFISIWNGKYKYYADIAKKRKLNNMEKLLLKKVTALIFDAWRYYYSVAVADVNSTQLIQKCISKNSFSEMLFALTKEEDKFKNDPDRYILEILDKGMDHPLASIDKVNINCFSNIDFFNDNIYKKHKVFFKKAHRLELIRNLRNNKLPFKKCINSFAKFIKTRSSEDLRYPLNYLRCLNSIKNLQKISLKPNWQYIASARSQINAFENTISHRDSSKPFFASMHFLEAHNNLSFFSYDINDTQVIDEEISVLNDFLNGIDKKFKGNLSYQLSLRYVDLCLEKLCNILKNNGLYDNTTLLIVADHGTSYRYFPLRKHMVNTFHKENYNVPFIMRSKKLSVGMHKEGMYSSKDVLPTVLGFLGLNIPKELDGINIMRDTLGRNIVITEYMGPGVPDMLEREVWISARDADYMVAYKLPIGRCFGMAKPICAFDRKNDPLELVDLSKNESIYPKISHLIEAVKIRFEQIQNDTKNYLKQLL